MKKINIYRFMAFLLAASAIFTACTKETAEVRLDPILSTSQTINITSSTATVVGFVVAEGDGFTEKGVCYNTATAPTIADSKVAYTQENTKATYNVILSELDYATKYYARAYATGTAGTIYGEEVTFTTLPVLPTLTTAAITEIEGTSATTGGNITNNGGSEITARGVCFSLNTNPTISDSKTSDGTGSGEFISFLDGLKGLTTYYVRAYATNSVGISYGDEIMFTTLVSIRHWNIVGDYLEASYPGSDFANWAPDKSPQVQSLESSSDNLEGYVYMAGAANEWKFATQPNWDGPNYGDDGFGGLDADAGNIVSPAGYYKINADAGAMTYTAVATVWGVIGDASPNGWTDETALTYDPAATEWRGVMHLTAANFKFRANHSWDYNYGSDNADGNLEAGGSDIPVDIESDYSITLDLSHPNEYTYTTNRWGIIGDAQGSWDNDTNMTWDATNNLFTVTLDLVSTGKFKIRANDDWAINYGGDLNALEAGGADIAVATDGNYTITFDPWGLIATVTKN